MKSMTCFLVALLAFSGVSKAQMSAEEAQSRLKARVAQREATTQPAVAKVPTTRPTTQPHGHLGLQGAAFEEFRHSIEQKNPDALKQLQLPPLTMGIVLTGVNKDGPVAKAGLKSGDIILRCGSFVFK